MSTASTLLFGLLTQSALAQTVNQPYVATWHLNVAKSDIGTIGIGSRRSATTNPPCACT